MTGPYSSCAVGWYHSYVWNLDSCPCGLFCPHGKLGLVSEVSWIPLGVEEECGFPGPEVPEQRSGYVLLVKKQVTRPAVVSGLGTLIPVLMGRGA